MQLEDWTWHPALSKSQKEMLRTGRARVTMHDLCLIFEILDDTPVTEIR